MQTNQTETNQAETNRGESNRVRSKLVVHKETNAYSVVPSFNDWWHDEQPVDDSQIATIEEFQQLLTKNHNLAGVKQLALDDQLDDQFPIETMKNLINLLKGLKHLEIGFPLTKQLDLNLPNLETLYVEFPLKAKLKITSDKLTKIYCEDNEPNKLGKQKKESMLTVSKPEKITEATVWLVPGAVLKFVNLEHLKTRDFGTVNLDKLGENLKHLKTLEITLTTKEIIDGNMPAAARSRSNKRQKQDVDEKADEVLKLIKLNLKKFLKREATIDLFVSGVKFTEGQLDDLVRNEDPTVFFVRNAAAICRPLDFVFSLNVATVYEKYRNRRFPTSFIKKFTKVDTLVIDRVAGEDGFLRFFKDYTTIHPYVHELIISCELTDAFWASLNEHCPNLTRISFEKVSAPAAWERQYKNNFAYLT